MGNVPFVTLVRNTRGANSRPIEFKAIGKYIDKEIERETYVLKDEQGNPILDEKGNEKREYYPKDANGKQITKMEITKEFVTDGVLTDMEDAVRIVGGTPEEAEQIILDCFVEGFNERQYRIEAGKDELDTFFADLAMTDEDRNTLKRAARLLARATEAEVKDVAPLVKAQWLKKQKVTA